MELSNRVFSVLLLLAGLTAAGACGSPEPTGPEEVAGDRLQAETREVPASARNTPPAITGIQFDPERPVPGDMLRARVSASDGEQDPFWFRYEWRVDGKLVDHDTGKLPLDRASKGQVVELTVVASDGKQDSKPMRERVELENRVPKIVGVTIEPGRQVVAGTPIVAHPEGREPDGDAITYRYDWEVNGRRRQETGPALETRRLKRGDVVRLRITAGDGTARSEPAEVSIQIVNAPPRIVSRPPSRLDPGGFLYRVAAEDPDGDVGLQFQLEKAPEGMEIDPLSGAIRWEPRPDQVGEHPVAVIADDLQGGRSRQSFELTVGMPEAIPAAAAD
jgi:hypothetical protein